MKLVHTPWNKTNRIEWHRVQDRKRKGIRIVGGWWILFGRLHSLFN